MNSLLKRQIRKYLSPEMVEDENMKAFLNAVSNSYNNFDEQSVMIQRAMQLSSEELFHANAQLRKESEGQKKVINKLQNVIKTLKIHELPQSDKRDILELDGNRLIDFIDNQAREIIQVNKQSEKLLKSLELQNEELSNYAHMVSHDLKSPLRSIDALTMWIIEDYADKLDENGMANLELIRSNVVRMEALINGILEYSTIDKSLVKTYDVDLNFLVSDLLKTMYIPNRVQVNIKNRLPVVKGDNLRFRQLFQNLIGNAIKYNDKENGIINVGCINKERYWQFYVEDNGIGIDEQYFKKIFKTFEKLNSNADSTGIGLSIVKKIIDLYNGEIWLTSSLGEGTTFYFTFKK